ncbi:MAG: DUF368 domain-containing protein [Oscillospiraceae bacterium]|jgi:uncharacterized membrane protein|nr:DUF368 domain-containing protein [Oscillospiraceae bacterium]
MNKLLLALQGLLFGLSATMPGVSGSGLLMSIGAHENAVNALSPKPSELKRKLPYTISFSVGAVIGAVAFALFLSAIVKRYPTASYFFVEGLIAGAIPLAFRFAYVNRKSITGRNITIFVFALGVSIAAGFTHGASSSDYSLTQEPMKGNPAATVVTLTNNTKSTVKEWSISYPQGKVSSVSGAKQIHTQSLAESFLARFRDSEPGKPNAFVPDDGAPKTIAPGKSVTFVYAAKLRDKLQLSADVTYKLDAILFIELLGAGFFAAGAAMIPGVSASLIMSMFGVYATVINGLKNIDVAVLLPAAVGIMAGAFCGSYLVRSFSSRNFEMYYSMILGLFLGSMFIMFPDNVTFGAELIVGLVLFALGVAISFTITAEKRSAEDLRSVFDS